MGPIDIWRRRRPQILTTFVIIAVAILLGSSAAYAHDVGKPLQVLDFASQPTSPYYWCLYGENHLWESDVNTMTYASGTTSRSNVWCANLQTSNTIGVQQRILRWDRGNSWECTGFVPEYAYNVNAIGSTWPNFQKFPAFCGNGYDYTVQSSHWMLGDSGMPASNIGWKIQLSSPHAI